MTFSVESFFSIWRRKRFWASVPTTEQESDVEKRFLDDASLDDASRSTSEDGDLKWSSAPAQNTFRRHSTSWILLSANILIFCASLWANRSALWDENYCVKKTSFFSPVTESMKIKLHDVTLNGTVWPAMGELGWTRLPKGDPTGEEMWESFENITTFPITRQDVIRLGKDPATVAKFEDDFWGLGDDAYIATIDATHKMHCLNELRKAAFDTFDRKRPRKKQHSQLWWLHQRHCLDMLAQDIVCHADSEVFTFQWVDTQRKPFPDFNINRKCRSMDDLFEFRRTHGVDMEKYLTMKKPKHVHQVPNEPGYYAMFGFEGSDLFPGGMGAPELPDLTEWFGNASRNDGNGKWNNIGGRDQQ